MSTHQSRRRNRRIRLLVVAALVAIRIAVPAVSKAEPMKWHAPAAAAAVNTNMAADALAQGLPKSMVFLGGFTTQHWPVVVVVARGAKQIPVAAVGIDVTCTSGEQFSTEDAFAHLTVARNGRVHESDLIPPHGSNFLGGSHSLTGRLQERRSTFQGIWQLQLMFKAPDGTTDTCRSGPVALLATL